MNTETRKRLTTLFYVLTRDHLSWGTLHSVIDEHALVGDDQHVYCSAPGRDLAAAAVDRLVGQDEAPEVSTTQRLADGTHVFVEPDRVQLGGARPGHAGRVAKVEGVSADDRFVMVKHFGGATISYYATEVSPVEALVGRTFKHRDGRTCVLVSAREPTYEIRWEGVLCTVAVGMTGFLLGDFTLLPAAPEAAKDATEPAEQPERTPLDDDAQPTSATTPSEIEALFKRVTRPHLLCDRPRVRVAYADGSTREGTPLYASASRKLACGVIDSYDVRWASASDVHYSEPGRGRQVTASAVDYAEQIVSVHVLPSEPAKTEAPEPAPIAKPMRPDVGFSTRRKLGELLGLEQDPSSPDILAAVAALIARAEPKAQAPDERKLAFDSAERIAARYFGWPTLACRGRDHLDFHGVSVGATYDALAAAYKLGLNETWIAQRVGSMQAAAAS